MDESIILSLSHEELYRIFIAKLRDLREAELITDKDIQHVRYGKSIMFPLHKYFKYKDNPTTGLFRIKPKDNTINVDGQGHMDYNVFIEEIEYRCGIMLNSLLDYYSEDDSRLEMDNGEDIR